MASQRSGATRHCGTLQVKSYMLTSEWSFSKKAVKYQQWQQQQVGWVYQQWGASSGSSCGEWGGRGRGWRLRAGLQCCTADIQLNHTALCRRRDTHTTYTQLDRVAERQAAATEGRPPNASLPQLAASNEAAASPGRFRAPRVLEMRARGGKCFDFEYYVKENPDLKVLGSKQEDLWRHFVYTGQFEAREHRWALVWVCVAARVRVSCVCGGVEWHLDICMV